MADGQVYGTCRPRKYFADFQAFLLQEIIPEALRREVHTVILIVDNGTSHARYPARRLATGAGTGL